VKWAVLIVLVLVGVAGAALRATNPTDSGTRMEPARQQIFAALRLTQLRADERAAELDRFDSRFAAHRAATLLHIVPGALVLLLAPLQFLTRGRPKYARVHRWSGWVIVSLAVVAMGPALFFGMRMPYGGTAESIPIALFSVVLLVALYRAVVAIRARRAAEHREWMIRAFAVLIAISTVRLVAIPIDLFTTPLGLGPRAQFVFAVWTGWLVTLASAEWWIRRTRAPAQGLDVALVQTSSSLPSG
jgi:uncharacterized membrane protein